MTDDGFDLGELIAEPAPNTIRLGNGTKPDPDLAAAAALAARHHPELEAPWPAGIENVPDYYDDEPFNAADRPLELIRYDRLPNEPPPEAGILYRPDGRGLFYMGAVNSIAGDPGVGKTFAALLAVLAALAQGLHVLLIDYEDTPGRLRARLVALGVPEDLMALVHGIKDPDRLYPSHVDQLLELIRTEGIAVVVIDSVTEALEAHDLDENSGGDYSRWHRTVPKRIAIAGPCVIVIDHRPKPTQSIRGMTRNLWAVATRHKLAANDLSYILEAREPFSRAEPGRTGKLDLIVAKDKHGSIGGRGDIVARFELTPTTEGAIDHTVDLPANRVEVDADGERLTGLERLLTRRAELLPLIHDVWELELAKDPNLVGLSTNRIADYLRTLPIEKRPAGPRIAGRDNDFLAVLRAWADSGYLEHSIGPRKANLFRPIEAIIADLFHQPDNNPNIEPFEPTDYNEPF